MRRVGRCIVGIFISPRGIFSAWFYGGEGWEDLEAIDVTASVAHVAKERFGFVIWASECHDAWRCVSSERRGAVKVVRGQET